MQPRSAQSDEVPARRRQFDADLFAAVVELVITAMDISICFADFPTEKITETTRAYRQLGIGYANLGALLMATGHGVRLGRRALGRGGDHLADDGCRLQPLGGTGRRRRPVRRLRPQRRAAQAGHAQARAANDGSDVRRLATPMIHDGDQASGSSACRSATRTAGATLRPALLAPTGCLTPDTLVTTDRGLVRLGELGDVYGRPVAGSRRPDGLHRRWAAARRPSSSSTVRSRPGASSPRAGTAIQGTLTHRVKVVESGTGEWVWKRLADVAPGDIVPMQTGNVDRHRRRRVPLPVLDQAYYAGDRDTRRAGCRSTRELAELVGYFMGDGSLHAKGIRLCVAEHGLGRGRAPAGAQQVPVRA